VLTSTDPAGGAAAWHRAQVDPGARLTELACPTTSLCLAAGGSELLYSANPAGGASAWHGFSFSDGLGDLSCPSAHLCVGFTGEGGLVATTDPTGGASAWHSFQVPGIMDIYGLTCASAKLCLATGDYVNSANAVFYSTSPAGGASAWTAVDTSPVPDILTCPSPHLCVGVGAGANVIDTSARPTAGGAAWTKTELAIPADDTGSALACASVSLCVYGGDNGDLVVGKAP
jgi:hypothetical protein